MKQATKPTILQQQKQQQRQPGRPRQPRRHFRSISEAIRFARMQADLTMEAAAWELGSTYPTLSRYELLEVVIPLMWAKLDELGETLDQLLEMVREKESFQDYSPAEWEALTECAELMRRFVRDMEILEASMDRRIEQAEKKTACAAKR